jgi:hypothetical protein
MPDFLQARDHRARAPRRDSSPPTAAGGAAALLNAPDLSPFAWRCASARRERALLLPGFHFDICHLHFITIISQYQTREMMFESRKIFKELRKSFKQQ